MIENRALIPRNVIRKLGHHAPKSNQEVIINYLTQEKGMVELNEEQQRMLDRWDYADNLMRQRKYKKMEIAKMICKKFDVAISTARADMSEAEYIFGSTRKFSKVYLLYTHLDRIDEYIIQAEREGKEDLKIKLLEIYNRAIFSMPDEIKKELPPTKIVFNMTQNNTKNELYMPDSFNEEDAKKVAADKLKALGVDISTLNLEE